MGELTVTDDDRNMAAIAYAGGCFSFLVPLVILFIGKSDFVRHHAGKAALGHFVASLGVVVVSFVTCGFGAPVVFLMWGWGLYEAVQVMNTKTA